MRLCAAIVTCTLVLSQTASALPNVPALLGHKRNHISNINRELAGKVIDYSDNHGRDYRVWSAALGEKRSMYVYLPPGYDGTTAYPVMIWLHGFGQAEKNFLDIITDIDRGIQNGKFPPCVIASPDGSLHGRPALIKGGSFYMNSKAGRYEDYIVHDIWAFMLNNYRIRPEREAHVLAGASMGGYGAFMLGFSHRETFGVIGGILPPLDVRYADCNDYYFSPYDPNCIMERDHVRRFRVIANFHGIKVRERRLTDSLLGRRAPDGLRPLAAVNPVEMLVNLDIRPGEFAMFIGYAGRDEFNLNAQADHFLDVARQRGICATTLFLPDGNHSVATGKRMIPEFAAWLSTTLSPYVPACERNTLTNVGPAYDLLTSPAPVQYFGQPGLFEQASLWPIQSR
ncbi:hypothetical protein BH11PLA2_BH11PLA2_33590 [soil metagenome]